MKYFVFAGYDGYEQGGIFDLVAVAESLKDAQDWFTGDLTEKGNPDWSHIMDSEGTTYRILGFPEWHTS